ncbi:MAG: HAD-IC family P-type ATPase [Inquilinaceae bacterium]
MSAPSAIKDGNAIPWHAQSVDQVLDTVRATPSGLTAAEAERRLAQVGANRLTPPKRRSLAMRFFSQFNNVLIYVLVVASLVTAALGHWIDSGVIAGVVLINATIGFLQEGKAERALDAIRILLSLQAVAVRDGVRTTVPAETLVPGDIVFVQSGDKVPADLRVIDAKGLRAQEAALTGESASVDKTGDPVRPDAALGDRTGLLFSGTLVASGQGTGVVVATGDGTELGRIGALLSGVKAMTTPLLRQLAVFGRWLTAAILAFTMIAFAFGTLVHGMAAGEMFLAAVGLAVAAIPEGLPAVVTITLAIGVERMARRNAIIRRLPAVETLGSVSVICADKTGTFTHNEMTVQSVAAGSAVLRVTGSGYEPLGDILSEERPIDGAMREFLHPLALGALLCNEADVHADGNDWAISGDPMEAALLVFAGKAGLDVQADVKVWPRTDVIPFESERRYMATLHHDHAGHGRIYVKGAPEHIIARCARQRDEDGERPIDPDHWRDRIDALAAGGERVLALAMKPTDPERRILRYADVDDGLTLLGLFGIADPPREEAIAAVDRCRRAGIAVKMITGDHAGTAGAIARRLGLEHPAPVLTGPDIDALDDAALADRVAGVDVFARTSPEHKLRLVAALQAQGRIVAMTGDGVNDAPALKRADVGVAMGRKGSEAAKEAAAMVLADDNFASIADAVEEGRTVYDNVRKGLLFILPTSAGEAATIAAAVGLGTLLPITAVQILWVNMITAVTLALALAFEPAEADVMKRPPRRTADPLLSPFLIWRVVLVATVLVAGVFGVFLWLLERGAALDVARTAAVNTLVLYELFYLFNVRKLNAPAWSGLASGQSRVIWLAVGVVIAVQMLFIYVPAFQVLFRSAPLDVGAWTVSAGVAATIFLLVEIEKALTGLVRVTSRR